MARILITGGSGFIGTNLVQYYLDRGDDVMNVDIRPPGQTVHSAVWRNVNLLDDEALAQAVRDHAPEVVFHFAARTDLEGKTPTDYLANTDGVRNLIRALQDQPSLAFVVFASSMLVCRIGYQPRGEDDYCPSTAYGRSKVEGEHIVRQAARGFRWAIVRPTSIWGPWFGTPYRDFFTAVRRGFYLHPRHRSIRRSYGFVLNSVAQLAALVDSADRFAGRTMYLADYEPVELKSWADMIQRAFGARTVPEVPLALLRVAARTGDLLQRAGWRLPPMTSFRLNNLLTDMVHDTTPLQDALPQLPYTMQEGVDITVRWMRQHPIPV
jgi:nucleoside-diphosphate-sugar epimerase